MSKSKQQKVAAAAIILSEWMSDSEEEEVPKRKRIWVKEWMKERETKSDTKLLLRDLELTSPQDYRNYLRMDAVVYQKLLELVTPLIIKQNTQMRDAITPPLEASCNN